MPNSTFTKFKVRKSHQVMVLTLILLLSLQHLAFGREIGSPVKTLRANITSPVVQSQLKPLIDCWPTTSGRKIDLDRDGIVDRCEQTLAEKFAPVVYHSSGETNYPTNVDWFLRRTSLWFYDDDCEPDLHYPIYDHPTQYQLLYNQITGGCDATDTVYSDNTRSRTKQRTFYLKDVEGDDKLGSINNTSEWTTYFHAYRNDRHGVTLQYWRFYAADGGKDEYIGVFGGHGGDWEGIHVVLDDCLRAVQVNFMGHTDIEAVPWSEILKAAGTDHPIVRSEVGGHATHPYVPIPFILPFQRFTKHESWTGGNVVWYDGRTTPSGALLNIGEKMSPLNGQYFIRYSGIWGSPGFTYYTSGYWNPAYNETGMGDDNFIKAWCTGRAADVPYLECNPKFRSR